MVKVAVAGGTGGLGLCVVEGIVEAGEHEVIVLSRNPTHPVLEKLNVPVLIVSYDDPVALTKALEGVHTVISTIAGTTEDTLVKPQLALLDAAVKAGVKRFAPGEFALHSTPDHPIENVRSKSPVAEAVKRSGLEYTIYENGIFMNYLANGTPGLGYVYPMNFQIDVENCTATLPGDGSAYVVYTRAEDIGKFVAASISLEKWPELSQMRGDRMKFNEVLQLLEEARGRKFNVTYQSEEQLVQIIAARNALPKQQHHERYGAIDGEKFLAQCWLEVLRGNPFGYEGKNLNELCPQVRPMTIAEFLKKWWGSQ